MTAKNASPPSQHIVPVSSGDQVELWVLLSLFVWHFGFGSLSFRSCLFSLNLQIKAKFHVNGFGDLQSFGGPIGG